MPTLSVDAWLRREIELSRPEARYADLGMILRRLTVDTAPGVKLKRGDVVTATDGTAFRIAKSCDERVAVSAVDARQGRRFCGGEALFLPAGAAAGVLREERIIKAGGRWDRIERDWVRDAAGRRELAQKPLLITIVESQVALARWWRGWMRNFGERRPQTQSGSLVWGRRRGGKTWIGLLLVVAAAVDNPKIDGSSTLGWLVSVDHPSRQELDREFREVIPGDWWTYREQPSGKSPAHCYTLATGALLVHRTAEDPEALRNGRVDLALCNELGKFSELAFRNVLHATKDKDGACLATTNRPRRSKSNFAAVLAKQIKLDQSKGIVPDFDYHELDDSLNDRKSGEATERVDRILARLNPDDADEGALLEVGQYCYAEAFDEAKNVAAVPELLPDITRQVTRRILGYERDFLVGTDFQARPGCVATVWKVYGTLPDRWILWCVRVVWAEDGGEEALISELDDFGISADTAVIIADASSEWQTHDHSRKGLGSFRYFQDARFIIRGPQPKKDRKYGSNPRPKELQVQRLRELLQEARPGGLRAMMISDDAAAKPLVYDLQKCKAGKGKAGGAIPVGESSHSTDTAAYVAWATLLALRPAEVKQRQALTSAGAAVTKFNR